MRLLISTPADIVLEQDGIAHLRAEDASGAFGILPGHADFLTALPISVASWRLAQGGERHCALRGGVLTVSGGEKIEIATRQAVLGTDLAQLETEVLQAFHRANDEEERARTEAARMQVAAIRQICGYLRPDRGIPLLSRAGALRQLPPE